MKTAFLYAGQGTQRPGMGLDIYEKYDEYKAVVESEKISDKYIALIKEASMEEISQTENTQPCIAIFQAGVTDILKKHGIHPDGVCGLSLGEYGALYASGVMDSDTYVNLTAFRGQKMMEAAKGIECSMSAIIGTSAEVVTKACESYQGEGYVTVANYNCAGQYVICGDEIAVAGVEKMLKEQGVKRCIRLNVSGPFHTKYMQSASDALKEKLKEVDLNEPNIPLVMNYTGEYFSKEESLKDIMTKQVCNSVQFEKSLTKLLEDGFERFIEIGPGNVLSGFLKKTAKAMDVEIKVESIDGLESLEKVLEGEKNDR